MLSVAFRSYSTVAGLIVSCDCNGAVGIDDAHLLIGRCVLVSGGRSHTQQLHHFAVDDEVADNDEGTRRVVTEDRQRNHKLRILGWNVLADSVLRPKNAVRDDGIPDDSDNGNPTTDPNCRVIRSKERWTCDI